MWAVVADPQNGWALAGLGLCLVVSFLFRCREAAERRTIPDPGQKTDSQCDSDGGGRKECGVYTTLIM